MWPVDSVCASARASMSVAFSYSSTINVSFYAACVLWKKTAATVFELSEVREFQLHPATSTTSPSTTDLSTPPHTHTEAYVLLLLVCVSLTIIGQPRNSVLIRRV